MSLRAPTLTIPIGAGLETEVIAVAAAWHAFSVHAGPEGSPDADCAGVRQVACHGGQSDWLNALWSRCCEQGRPLYAEWRQAVDVLRASFVEHRPR